MSRPVAARRDRTKARLALHPCETWEAPNSVVGLVGIATFGDLFGPTAFLRTVSLDDLPTAVGENRPVAAEKAESLRVPVGDGAERPAVVRRTTEPAVDEPDEPIAVVGPVAELFDADGPVTDLSPFPAGVTAVTVTGAGVTGPRMAGGASAGTPAVATPIAPPASATAVEPSPLAAQEPGPTPVAALAAAKPTPKKAKKGPKSVLDTVTVEVIGRQNPLSGGVGGFRIWRQGTAGDLTVQYKMTGGAVPGVDYVPLSGTVTITDGNRSAALPLDPLKFSPAVGGKTIRLTLRADPTYALGGAVSGRVKLGLFAETPVVTVAAIDPGASDVGQPNRGTVKVSRTTTVGNLRVDVEVGGTATAGTDYKPLRTTVVIPAGMTWASFRVTPVSDTEAEGPETVVVGVRASSRYTVGAEAAATVRIDDTAAKPGRSGPGGPPMSLDAPELSLLYCECGCPTGTTPSVHGLWGAVGGALAGLAQYPFSAYPVHYGVGQVRLGSTDLDSGGVGGPWGQSRTWSNLDGYDQHSQLGIGWATEQAPYLVRESSLLPVVLVLNANYTQTFNETTTNVYTEAVGRSETLTHDNTAKEFTYTDTTGRVMVFFDFDSSYPVEQRGGIKTVTEPDGLVTSVTSRDTDGRITEVQRARTVGGTLYTESFVTNYLTSGTNTGRASDVTLRRKVGAGSWSTVRSVDYTYYDGTGSGGGAGNLKRAIVKDAGGTPISTDYYRYYVALEANGYEHGLKYYVGGAQYARMADALGAGNIDSASDSAIADFANNYFEYQSDHRVTKEIAAGAGCSACSAGFGEYTYAYTDQTGGVTFLNEWATKTVETLPDGNQNIVYTNYAGGLMLKSYKDTTTSDEWTRYWRFDEATGNVVLAAEPSAVSGYNDTYSDVMDYVYGASPYLRDAAGLVQERTYATSTTATTSTAGDVAGYLSQIDLLRGEAGTAVPQYAATYIERTAGGVTVYPTAAETVFRNTNGTGGQTTTNTYTWVSGTTRVEQVTVARPAATTGQNGSNSADSDVVVFDLDGRPVWVKDAAGFIHYTAYDAATGAVVKTIVDVDTTQTSDFTGLPSGWSTPGGGGKHLKSTYEVDALRRTTKETSPDGDVTYTVHNDAAHEVRVYPGWNTGTDTPTGPTIVMRDDWAEGYSEALSMSATPAVSSGRPTGTESVSGVQSLRREVRNDAGQTVYGDEYFDLTGTSYTASSAAFGTSGTNYNRTQFGFDKMGHPNKTVTPSGTIYRTFNDGQGRPISKWVGTDDTPTSGFWSPTNLTGTNTVQVWGGEYDGGGVGDGNLTEETEFPAGGAADRVTAHSFDWRNRPVASKAGVETSESTSLNRPIRYVEYDNLSQVVASELYDGDTLSITTDGNTDGVPDRPSSSALRAKNTAAFDEQGRVYQAKTFSVDPSSGSVSSNAVETNFWYDARGLGIKTSAPGGLVTKTTHDGAGRPTVQYQTDGGGDSVFGNADDVTGDAVLTETAWAYDPDGNVTLLTHKDRFHDETVTGALGDDSTSPKARVSFVANYYDKADRLTDVVDVGTYGGSAYTRPGSPDSRDDTHLVTSYGYNVAGWLETVTDPRALVGKTYYDLAARTTKTIENYVNGTPSDADDKTVEYTYDGLGQVKTLKALLTSGNQTTEYVYGISGGLVSNDIVGTVKHPDASTGNASTSEQETLTYNQLGQVLTRTDRNGNVHTYTYDVLGRVTADAVTTLGSGVDGTVRRIETAYDSQGNAFLITSYDAATSGSVVNEVQREYNGLGQLTREWQAVGGAVNTSTSPSVQYGYSFAPSGSTNHSRLETVTYPNGRVLTYNYASGLSADISRLSSITDGGTTLEGYEYLGLGVVVKRAHPQPSVDLTYIKFSGESDGDAGDKYVGLDRFGRVVDQRWTTSTPTAKDRWNYGYDRDSNRLYKENVVDSSRSELYGYDGLNQLTNFERGTLNGGKTALTGAASRSQLWDFDALGNFDSQTTDGGTAQTRGHNKQNEITSISGATTPTYDANGSLTTDEAGRTFKYDAWNRLVEVRDNTTALTGTYRFDGLTRRIRETHGGTTTDLYYSAAWQVLEERVGSAVQVSYAWSPVYVDALIARDRDTDANGSLDERLYVAQDVNFNVTALLDTSGNVVERYAQDPFGGFVVLTAAFGARTATLYAWRYVHQGLRWDASTGAYNVRYREQSPTFGRWLQMDPIGFAGGDVHVYRYEHNLPSTRVDPSGLYDGGAIPPGASSLPTEDEFNDWMDRNVGERIAGWFGVDDIAGPINGGSNGGAASGTIVGGSLGAIGGARFGPIGVICGAIGGGLMGGVRGSAAGSATGGSFWDGIGGGADQGIREGGKFVIVGRGVGPAPSRPPTQGGTSAGSTMGPGGNRSGSTGPGNTAGPGGNRSGDTGPGNTVGPGGNRPGDSGPGGSQIVGGSNWTGGGPRSAPPTNPGTGMGGAPRPTPPQVPPRRGDYPRGTMFWRNPDGTWGFRFPNSPFSPDATLPPGARWAVPPW